MIEPLNPNQGDVRDGMTEVKVNEIIADLNKQPVSSHPHLVRVERNQGGFIFDFSGLVEAIQVQLGKQL